VRQQRRAPFARLDRMFASQLTPGISVLIASRTEHTEQQAPLLRTVRAVLAQRYPTFEVVLVDDGGTREAFDRLRAEFGLTEVPAPPGADLPVRGPVRGIHLAGAACPLTLVRKEPGGRADALNAGVNVARHPLVCLLPAGALLEPDGLLHLAKPFVDDPWRVVATGTAIRTAIHTVAGSHVERGRLVGARMPRSWRARLNSMTHLRAYLVDRSGWGRLGGLLIGGTAVPVYRRDLLVEAGGLSTDRPAPEADLLARLHEAHGPHRTHRTQREAPDAAHGAAQRSRAVFVGVPICWSDRPPGRQALPRLPRAALVEALSPVLGLAGFGAFLATLPLDPVSGALLGVYTLAWLGYGVLLATVLLAMHEFTFYRSPQPREYGPILLAAVADALGYRRGYAWWRWRGLLVARSAQPGGTRGR
jgi:glycosyltransferase involved in cell wall biosynthesis